jgi:uncharacterized protein
MLQPARVNIVDLSDVENLDVRSLAIAAMWRGILNQQHELCDAATKDKPENTEIDPLMTNVIIEEAHEFLSARRLQRMPTLREQFMKIAKRGRKRYLGLTFVIPSPNDLPDDVVGKILRLGIRACRTRPERRGSIFWPYWGRSSAPYRSRNPRC